MTHDEAKALIDQSGLIPACHLDLAAVQAIFEPRPDLVEAMNALTPKPGDETPQRAAAHTRKIDILQYFLSRGVQPDLFMSCALGLTGPVNAYLTAHPKEVDAKGAHGIQLGAHVNHPQMVELLLKHGAEPTLFLIQLCWTGKVELIQIAIDHGAKINSEHGRQPLHIAACQGHLAAVELLVKLGADTLVRSKGADWERKNALALAHMNNHTEVENFLRKHTNLPPAAPFKSPLAPARKPFRR